MEVCLLDNEKHYVLCSSPNIIRLIDRRWQEVWDICHACGREEKCLQSFGRET